jgi:putative SOS response-associated peptidase YedK
MISLFSTQLSQKQIKAFCPDLKLPEVLICSKRHRPKDYVDIWLNKKPKEAQWGLIPSTADNDLQQHNRIGILNTDIGHSPSYRLLARRKRAFIFIDSFYHNTMKGGERSRHQIIPKDVDILAVPVVYDEWVDPDDQNEYITFSIIHQQIERADQRLPGIVPVLFKNMGQLEEWLDLEHLPHQVNWPNFDVEDFRIKSKKIDLSLHPAFEPIVPEENTPDHFKNIA